MDDAERLKELQERRSGYERTIHNIDDDIRRAEDALIKGEEPSRLVAFLRERHETQRGLIYDLGKIEARADDLQARIAERDNRSQENAASGRWEDARPGASEEVAWYRKQNNSPVQQASDGRQDRAADKPRDWFATRDRPAQDEEQEDRDRNRTR